MAPAICNPEPKALATVAGPSRQRRFTAHMVVGVLLLFARLAHADMWIYVDERGVKNYANSQVDPRYKPLLGSMPMVGSVGSGEAQIDSHLSASAASFKSIAAMEMSPGFRAVKQHVRTAAEANQLDFALLQAVIATESGFDTRAVSPKGAMGLMQLMPATAERYGVTNDKAGTVSAKLTDPKTNIHTGARYLRDLVNLFPGQLELAVAAYNAGEGAVQRAGNKIPNYKETQNYVQSVMQLYKRLSPPTQRLQASVYRGRVRAEFHGASNASTAGPTATADAAQPEMLN